VSTAAKGRFLTLRYDWTFDAESQEGFLLIGFNSRDSVALASFGDSWHMGDGLMGCRGDVSPLGVSVKGSYPVKGSPDWGWRIDVNAAADLRVVMYNLQPDGTEDLGFELIYGQRTGEQ
jgi:hypothetical protein